MRIKADLTRAEQQLLVDALAPRSKAATLDWYFRIRKWLAENDKLPEGQRTVLKAPALSRDTLVSGWLLYRAEQAIMRHRVNLLANRRSQIMEVVGPGYRYLHYGSMAPLGSTRRLFEKAGDAAAEMVRQLSRLSVDGHSRLTMCACGHGFSIEEFHKFCNRLDECPQILAEAAAALVEIDNTNPHRERLQRANIELVSYLAVYWERYQCRRPGCSSDGPFARYVVAALACVGVKNADPRRLIKMAREQAHKPLAESAS